IEGLLDFSKLGKLPVNKGVIEADKFIRGIIDEQISASGNTDIEVKLGVLENLNGDVYLMGHVFSNLISNAIKYSGKQTKPLIEIHSWKENNVITYAIKDNGVGFNNQYSDKMFEVFKRLHKESEFEGTGVGLAIVQRIVSKHGGKVWGEGQVNKGATFYVSLPG
ncbi:MAG TPA: ATP-binding protein, partial [Ignavibacteria bacterium]|nr:ATP-binding protein [Ignavibacteria bacterium]